MGGIISRYKVKHKNINIHAKNHLLTGNVLGVIKDYLFICLTIALNYVLNGYFDITN